MNNADTELNDLDIIVLNKLINTDKYHPIKSKILCEECNITFRRLKQIVKKLRNEYPIVAKETDGGGYWMAKTNDEIISFTNMIEARKNGYEETIFQMHKHLV